MKQTLKDFVLALLFMCAMSGFAVLLIEYFS
jgi:hypothetical protein